MWELDLASFIIGGLIMLVGMIVADALTNRNDTKKADRTISINVDGGQRADEILAKMRELSHKR